MGSISKVYALVERFGLDFEIAEFDHRIIVQKMICLLELKGLDLGYSYGLYLRGPYSPELTSDLYDRSDITNDDVELTLSEREAVDHVFVAESWRDLWR